jgi:hypothetical protein
VRRALEKASECIPFDAGLEWLSTIDAAPCVRPSQHMERRPRPSICDIKSAFDYLLLYD